MCVYVSYGCVGVTCVSLCPSVHLYSCMRAVVVLCVCTRCVGVCACGYGYECACWLVSVPVPVCARDVCLFGCCVWLCADVGGVCVVV